LLAKHGAEARARASSGGARVGALLSLEGVSKSYWRGDNELPVLKNISLEVRAGQFTAVWGTRGAGKTTLLKLAARLERPDSGSVCFEGVDLADLSARQHARLMLERIGWVRRSGPRSDLRMRDYVALPLLAVHGRRHAYVCADEAIERVGLAAQTRQRWGSLGEGERALFGVAHGIARAPRLLLVDDPTANLDVLERERVTELLHSLAGERAIAVLMAVPDMPAAMRADRIVSLGGGRLVGAEAPTPPSRVGARADGRGMVGYAKAVQ
jgi:ABC-type lipoprotein export system ATPase subunit